MGTNEDVRRAQEEKRSVPPGNFPILSMLAHSTDVPEEDVRKILEALGFFRIHPEAVRLNGGEDPPFEALRIGFRIGESTVVM